MRWSWRAEAVPVGLDALLEGSLVGVVYVALATGATGSSLPLSLVEFWAFAAVGLIWARRRPLEVPRSLWIGVLALVAGLVGWLADPGARASLATLSDPVGALRVHPAGWLLAAAVLRSAAHEQENDEIEACGRALGYAFAALTTSWLLHLGSNDRFVGPALVGSAVCVGAGLLAIAHARLRDLGLLNSDTRGGRVWARLATAVVLVVAAFAIAIALAGGTSARDALAAGAGPVGGLVAAILAPLGAPIAWLTSASGGILGGLPLPSLPGPGGGGNGGGGSGGLSVPAGPTAAPLLGWLILAAALVAAVILVYRVRRFAGRLPDPRRVAVQREEHRRDLHLPRLTLRLPPLSSPRRSPWRRPASAAEAYLAVLDDLKPRGELGRRAAETPLAHAERGGTLGLPRMPLGLLAADYELEVYGRARMSVHETGRAVGRWRRLQHVARDLSRHRGDE